MMEIICGINASMGAPSGSRSCINTMIDRGSGSVDVFPLLFFLTLVGFVLYVLLVVIPLKERLNFWTRRFDSIEQICINPISDTTIQRIRHFNPRATCSKCGQIDDVMSKKRREAT